MLLNLPTIFMMSGEVGLNHVVSPVKSFIAGGLSGMSVIAIGHPFDTIKGFHGLYKGMVTPMLGVTPMNAIFFSGFSIGKKLQTPGADGKYGYDQIFKAGMLAGVFTTVIVTPGERIKCLLQIQAASTEKAKYAGPLDCGKQIYRESGLFRGLYKGTAITLIRDVPTSGLYFLVYEWVKVSLTPAGKSPEDLNPLRILFAGGMAGVIMWLAIIAPDNLKSRIQTAPEGTYPRDVRDVFPRLIKNEGFPALFKGITPVMIRAFPASAVCLLTYELAMKFLIWSASTF
ncbi:mitochondrial carnitine/acylcarnitine carrier protein-like isoform X2 [Acanthaster planci]|uniref:Mitochondrial carnitine/acylcarnitine carrier protein-like isoform X2 n=1 Tax=Acanthaster planci TaxID=133434 RepID=A0A8B7ZIL0_ACAPL|nr:mitochondrial carnitine/acylcarnitine carrier protein-like isoform X2 [Acanthaster planci]